MSSALLDITIRNLLIVTVTLDETAS